MSREVHVRFCERLGHLSPADSTNSIDTPKDLSIELCGNGKGQDGHPCSKAIQRT